MFGGLDALAATDALEPWLFVSGFLHVSNVIL